MVRCERALTHHVEPGCRQMYNTLSHSNALILKKLISECALGANTTITDLAINQLCGSKKIQLKAYK